MNGENVRGFLSRNEIIKRMIIGEALIYSYCKSDNGSKCSKEVLDELNKIKDDLIECLKKWLLEQSKGENKKEASKEKALKEYLKKLESCRGFLCERRRIIKELVGRYFKESMKKDGIINEDEVIKHIKDDIKGIKDIEGILEYLIQKNKFKFPIFFDNPCYKCIREANYDLRLGEEVYVTSEKVPKKLNTREGENVVSIEPGEFGILMSFEYIFIPPDIVGFISVRLTFKQRGLVNISGFHVDPGFYGRIMFAVYNAGPNDVPLRYKERVFMIMFSVLTDSKIKIEESRWHGMVSIPIETIAGLRGTSVSPRNLHERIRRLEVMVPVIVTLFVTVIGAIVAWILSQLSK